MTETVLVQLIALLCNSAVNKELRIMCYEQYVNCAVQSSGTILSMKDFKAKCIKEAK